VRRSPRHHQHQGHGHPSHHEHSPGPEPAPPAATGSPSAWSRLASWFHEETRHRFRPDRPVVPRFLKIALVVLLLGGATVAIVGQVEASRRTQSAPVAIRDVDLPADPHPGVNANKLITYTFDVGGREAIGHALRSWSLDEIYAAHVCYDPADPGNNLLVKSGVTCG
jgi:hypothetical protein